MARAIIDLLPDLNTAGTNNFIRQPNVEDDGERYLGRLDLRPSGQDSWVPNLVGDPEGEKTVDSWFNTAAFAKVPAGVFGNAGRNLLRGPGYVTFDLTIQRRFPISGRYAASLRWDIFNVFDRANFGNPKADLNGSNVSTISSACRRSPHDASRRAAPLLTRRPRVS